MVALLIVQTHYSHCNVFHFLACITKQTPALKYSDYIWDTTTESAALRQTMGFNPVFTRLCPDILEIVGQFWCYSIFSFPDVRHKKSSLMSPRSVPSVHSIYTDIFQTNLMYFRKKMKRWKAFAAHLLYLYKMNITNPPSWDCFSSLSVRRHGTDSVIIFRDVSAICIPSSISERNELHSNSSRQSISKQRTPT